MDGCKVKFFETTYTYPTDGHKKSWSSSRNNYATSQIIRIYFEIRKVVTAIFLLEITEEFTERLETFSLKYSRS